VSPADRRRLYFVHRKLVARCTQPSDPGFERYGARGITVAAEWLTFDGFVASMPLGYTQGLTLERLENDGPYSPTNCKWATRFEQQANTRKTVRITARGETLPAREWSRRTGLHHSVILRRLRAGATPEEALRVAS
jgi:hypothetical protein